MPMRKRSLNVFGLMTLKPVVLGLIGLMLTASPACAQPASQPSAAKEAGEWTPLFNGKDFTGWYTYLKGPGKSIDPDKVFQVEDGVIHIYKDAPEASNQFMGYLATEKEYGDCRVRLEYKWGTKRFGKRAATVRDSGFLYFVTGADGAFSGGPWPYSVECQIQENDVGDTFAIGTQVSSTRDPAKRTEKQPTFKDDGEAYTSPPKGNNRIIRSEMLEHEGWNTVEVVLQGDTATHIINGKVNMRLTNIKAPDPDDKTQMVTVKKGKILLQAEGAEVYFRNVEVQPLNR